MLTLYTQFGGETQIRILVNNWFDISIELQHGLSKKSTEYQMRKEKYVQFIKYLLGGQKYYIGGSLMRSHSKHQITDEKFDEVLNGFSGALSMMRLKPYIC